ncbi:Eco29kI family restriction endonuclease [Thiothrix lacustris]|uniref:Eco29kI family restriction endonuclease n=1 Tax=Thiothrix lacustris TaxID=525917 RepID=UPI0027E41B6A|nr:Eco29kI family restriction endonuclease [Thiothrix lacustris]WMP15970.1 Eco29kI family restriction endonuclease [Thiothrix lacustris]
MKHLTFDRNEHIYTSTAFAELVKDAVRFFNGTPVHTLPPPEAFGGTGVYAIYYTGQHPAYKKYAELNRLAYNFPIYVGKAVPKGWRQARLSDDVLFEGEASDMIGTIEAALIKLNMPLWNTVVDGFGNHDPGKGRYEQAKSDWDVIHPGRAWAEKCKGTHSGAVAIVARVDAHLNQLGSQ